MTDVLLIYPKAGHDVRGVSVCAPLAHLQVASTLVQDFSVRILDQRVCDDFWADLKHVLSDRPLVVGITSMTGTQIYHGLEITKFVKEHLAVPVVWGGMHPTIYPAQTVIKPYIDFAIQGEGEEAMLKLTRLLARRGSDFESVPGLVWKRDGQLYCTPQADPLDMDQLPKIPWNLVNIEEYTSPTQYLHPGITRLLPYQGSRGCPFKCTFCSEPALTRRFRMMDPNKIVEECLEMIDTYNLDHIAFFDEEFFANRRWARRVAEGIGAKFTWTVQTRARDLLRMDLKEMERCGLQVVAPGLESGSNRMLAQMKKGETVDEYLEANRALAETHVTAQYNFIVGFPSETRQEIYETVDLVLELLASNPNATVNQLSPLTPLPGTELLQEVERDYDYRLPDRLEDWIFMTRGKQERPWFDAGRVRLIRFLYYTSLFVCSAERLTQKYGIPNFIVRLYSDSVRWRWQRKLMWLDWEIPLIRLVFRWFINPVDYTLSADYGDSYSAKESELYTLAPSAIDVKPLSLDASRATRPRVESAPKSVSSLSATAK